MLAEQICSRRIVLGTVEKLKISVYQKAKGKTSEKVKDDRDYESHDRACKRVSCRSIRETSEGCSKIMSAQNIDQMLSKWRELNFLKTLSIMSAAKYSHEKTARQSSLRTLFTSHSERPCGSKIP